MPLYCPHNPLHVGMKWVSSSLTPPAVPRSVCVCFTMCHADLNIFGGGGLLLDVFPRGGEETSHPWVITFVFVPQHKTQQTSKKKATTMVVPKDKRGLP